MTWIQLPLERMINNKKDSDLSFEVLLKEPEITRKKSYYAKHNETYSVRRKNINQWLVNTKIEEFCFISI